MKKHEKAMERPDRPLIEFYGPDQHPPVDYDADLDGSMSDYALVDIDGNAVKFVIGWFNFDDKAWVSTDDGVSIDKDHMRWSVLPLAKYEK